MIFGTEMFRVWLQEKLLAESMLTLVVDPRVTARDKDEFIILSRLTDVKDHAVVTTMTCRTVNDIDPFRALDDRRYMTVQIEPVRTPPVARKDRPYYRRGRW